MSYRIKYNKYVAKHSIKNFKISNPPQHKSYNYFMIIPAYNEYDYINITLSSISKQTLQKKLLVIIVINNSEHSTNNIVNNNKQTYKKLNSTKYPFEIILIDCFSKNHAFPKIVAGVGMARKVGLDFCLKYGNKTSLLCSLDADTLLNPKYLELVFNLFIDKKYKAAVVNFKHQKSEEPKTNQLVAEYEDILKYNAAELKRINSPYGYVSMGSTMICTVEAYISVGGMPKIKATEDFYFLQKLAKYTPIFNINEVLVYPSSRSEERVYLGTGYRLKKQSSIKHLRIPKSKIKSIYFLYRVIEEVGFKDINSAIEQIAKQDQTLYKFLYNHKIKNSMSLIIENSQSNEQFLKQFHRWFDNLKIYQFIKL